MPRRRIQPDVRIRTETEEYSVPAGAPSWVTTDLIEQTIRVWQPYYADRLTADDALAMILNVAGLCEVLAEGSHHETVRRTGTSE